MGHLSSRCQSCLRSEPQTGAALCAQVRAIVSYQHIDIEPSTAPLHHAPMPTARPPADCRVTHFGEFGIRFADDTGLLYWHLFRHGTKLFRAAPLALAQLCDATD